MISGADIWSIPRKWFICPIAEQRWFLKHCGAAPVALTILALESFIPKTFHFLPGHII
jgi:hypothetical protein